MAELGASLLPRLAGIVGEAHVLTAPADVEPFVADWRGRYHGSARAVVRPASTEEVAAVVRACAGSATPIVPQGGNTGLCGGAVPDDAGREIVVALRRMNRVRSVDTANATITVEAGVTLAARAGRGRRGRHALSVVARVRRQLHDRRQPVHQRRRNGGASLRQHARAGARASKSCSPTAACCPRCAVLRKDNTGYDLKQLFIGAEGTLGIVTAAVLKLFPAPRSQATALVARAARSKPRSRSCSRLKRALSDRLVGFELMSAFSLGLSRKHHAGSPDLLPGHAWYVLVQADDSAADAPLVAALESALADAVDAGEALDASVAQSKAQADALWALRENISEAQRREGPNIKHDISLPVSAIPAFLHESDAALLAAFPGARLVVFGHLGDGNLHYNLSAPRARMRATSWATPTRPTASCTTWWRGTAAASARSTASAS